MEGMGRLVLEAIRRPQDIPDFVYENAVLRPRDRLHTRRERCILSTSEIDAIFSEVVSVDQPKSQRYVMYHLLGDMVHTKDVSGDIVEIGAFRGKTTVFLSRALDALGLSKEIITIDPHTQHAIKAGCSGEDPKSAEETFRKATKNLSNHAHVAQPSGKAVSQLDSRDFSLIFVDGDHSYDGVLSDYENFAPLLSEGGIMVFDDYRNGQWPGVKEAVSEILARNKLTVDRRLLKTIHLQKP